MTERPILFNDDMVRAILSGQKRVTRRPIFSADVPPPEAVCPFGEPGDRLWVREAWRPSGRDSFEYRATCVYPSRARWKPSIHMPRAASRIVLGIRPDGVAIERLWEITDEDAFREGFPRRDARDRFAKAWDGIYGDRPGVGWFDNPWAWVVRFHVDEVVGGEAVKHVP